jgi:hypothetical protein
MPDAFVTSTSDLDELEDRVLSRLKTPWTVCSSPELDGLGQASTVYFVASRTSMCSTAYQELVRAAFGATEGRGRRLLRLDAAEIPLGFEMLKSLPERRPGEL